MYPAAYEPAIVHPVNKSGLRITDDGVIDLMGGTVTGVRVDPEKGITSVIGPESKTRAVRFSVASKSADVQSDTISISGSELNLDVPVDKIKIQGHPLDTMVLETEELSQRIEAIEEGLSPSGARSSNFYVSWNNIVDKPTDPWFGGGSYEHNHDDRYLKLTGGSVNGDLGISGTLMVDGALRVAGAEVATINETRTFVYEQIAAQTVWEISHNLKDYPTVTVVDSGGNVVVGDVEYLPPRPGEPYPYRIRIKFSAPFSGKAFLN